jgi:hypothetical protein
VTDTQNVSYSCIKVKPCVNFTLKYTNQKQGTNFPELKYMIINNLQIVTLYTILSEATWDGNWANEFVMRLSGVCKHLLVTGAKNQK